MPIVGLKWGTRLALSQLALSQLALSQVEGAEGVEGLALSQAEGVARFSSGISPTIGVGLIHELALQSGVVKLKDAPNQHRSIASFLF